MRRRAKVINFGILYGMGVNALRANLGTDRAQAQQFYNEYFATFADLARYLERTKIDAEVHGYTETYFGRRRSLEGIRSSIPYVKAAAERMAINAPIQGTQADLIKIAMARIDAYLQEQGLREEAYILLQVHDELVFEVKKASCKALVPELKRIMESVLTSEETHGVALRAEARQGANWGEMKAAS
jgi:DNA polymerase-1